MSADGASGRVIVITGAARGIGAATARTLAADGARLVLVDRAPDVQELADALPEALAVVGDVGDDGFADEVAQAAQRRFGGVDSLVCLAGVVQARRPLADVTPDEWDRVQRVNVRGSFLFVRAMVPMLRQAQGAAIVLVASVAGRVGQELACAYVTSKAAVLGLAKAAALDLAPDGISVNAVAPGVIDTELARTAMAGVAERRGVAAHAVVAEREAAIPAGRLGRPEDVADTIAFLASGRAGYVTGEVIGVDGGIRLGI